MFYLKTAKIYQAVKWGKLLGFGIAGFLKKLFLVLFFLVLAIFLYGFLTDAVNKDTQSFTLGLSVISLTLFFACWYKQAFFNSKLKKPKLNISIKEALKDPKKNNLAEFLDFETAKVAVGSLNSTAVLYRLLSKSKDLNFIFFRILLNPKDVKKLLKNYLAEVRPRENKKDFEEIILEALKVADKKGHQRITIGDLLTALAKYDLIFKKILVNANLKLWDIENLTWWLEFLQKRIRERKRFWEWKNLIKKGSIAKQWAAGYTITLDRFGIDYSELVKRRNYPETFGHKKEIKVIERILSRGEINNCLIVGEPGIGRKSMVLDLAKRSVLGESLPKVNYKRVVQLDLPALAAQTETMAEAEALLDRIFQETVAAGNIILVIDDFHNYVGGKERPGVIDISGIISSYLNLPQFQVVALTTFSGLHKYIEQNPSILSLFEQVEAVEVSERETLMILENLVLALEQKYKRFVSFPALREVVSLAKRYMSVVPFPKSAMDLLDEVMVHVASTKDKVILPKHVAEIVSEKTEIPVGEIKVKEKEILLNLEKLIHQRIINQDQAVKEVSAALRRARAEVTSRKGPMGTFLFLGPTGVGKTETSKALAQIYFGAEDKMIRLDMSEFQSITDIPRLLGSPGEEGLLTTQVRERPFSLILLDEIEKAHKNILNLFLQVLDEGFLTDGLGRKVDFKNAIIIATSNAGYQVILQALREKTDWPSVKQKLLGYIFEKSIFRPEFINRFDAVVVFSPLSKANLLDIAELMLQKLRKNLKEKAVEFIITVPLKEKIVELGYDPTFGAREMRRVIQDKVENVLASALLSGEIKRGDKVEINSEFKLIVNR
jgi:ATP-dependent Clp protease ATP-binding subunit ClpC